MSDVQTEHEALLEFVYLCPLAIAQVDRAGDVELMNSAGAQIFMQLGPAIDNLFDALTPYAPELRGLVDGLTATSGTICEAHRIDVVRPGARSALPLVLSLTLVKVNENRIMAVVADISKSAAQEKTARTAEERFRAILDGVRDYAIFAVDRNGLIDTWNKSAERLFGYTAAEIVGSPFRRLYATDGTAQSRVDTRVDALTQTALEHAWAEDEGWWARKETTRFWGSSVLSVVEDESGQIIGFTNIIRDLSRRRRKEEVLLQLANTDALTGAGNRRFLTEAGAVELERAHRDDDPLSVVVFDADHFKRVNDSYGHTSGDAVLKELARICRDQVRECDLVIRYGGEEFVLLLPSTDAAGARAAAERIRIAVESARVTRPEGVVRFTVSAGVAQVAPDDSDIDAIINRADAALYEAKRRGRNRTVVAGTASTNPNPEQVEKIQ